MVTSMICGKGLNRNRKTLNMLLRACLRVCGLFSDSWYVDAGGGLCRGFGGNSNYSAPGDGRSPSPRPEL